MTTRSQIKKIQDEIKEIHTALIELNKRIQSQFDNEFVREKTDLLESYLNRLGELGSQVEEQVKLGNIDVSKQDEVTLCLLLIENIQKAFAESHDILFSESNEQMNPNSSSAPILPTPDPQRNFYTPEQGIVNQYQRELGQAVGRPLPSQTPAPTNTQQPIHTLQSSTFVNTRQNIQFPTNSFPNQTNQNYPSNLTHHSILPFQEDEINQPEPQYTKQFNLKWADKVPKFDGTFEKFHSFINTFNQHIHCTNCDDCGKLLLLREKLDPKSLDLIAGILEPHYIEAYRTVVKYYTSSHPLQQRLKAKVENLPEIRNWYDTDKMRSNLAIIKDAYTVLAQSSNNRSFLETDFYYIVASKFPRDAVRDLMQKYGSKLTVSQYLTNITMYIEQNEQQQIILSKSNLSYSRNQNFRPRPKQNIQQNPFYNNFTPRNFNRTNYNPRISAPRYRQQQPTVTFPNEQQQLNAIMNTPSTSNATNIIVPYQQQQQLNAILNTPSTSGATNVMVPYQQQQQKQKFKQNKDCVFCKENHTPTSCPKPIKEKFKILNAQKRCVRCFSSFHLTNDCPLGFVCRLCHGKHNTSLCENRDNYPQTNVNTVFTGGNSLTMIKIKINNVENFGLYDPGASHSFIDLDLCKENGFDLIPCFATINEAVSTTQVVAKVLIKLKIGEITKCQEFFVIPNFKKIIIGIDVLDKFRIVRFIHGKVFQLLKNRRNEIMTYKSQDGKIKLQLNNLQEITDVEKIEKLKGEFSDVFTETGSVGKIDSYCEINLKHSVPINLRPYRTSPSDQELIDKQIEQLLEKDLIQISTSNYSFPVVLVDKKDDGKKTRLCVDYRKLNDITITESYPMPNIQDIENKLLNAKYFTTLDISSGFHHIPIKPSDRHKTAFATMNEHYEWKVMPFGLKNAPAIFQRSVYAILKQKGLIKFSHNYIDDIIVFSRTFDEHILHLEKVFKAMRESNIKLKTTKCKFAKSEVDYLGHNISHNSIRPLNSNRQAIIEFPSPTNLKSLRRFLGKINFYQRFIPNRTELLSPMYKLLRKNEKFDWSEENEESFKKIIKILASDLVLHLFDYSKTTILITDASNVGIGAVLKQKNTELDDDNSMVTVGYFSRKLLPYQMNYSATEKECLAIIESIKYWHHYLYGNTFIIRTDHRPLKYIQNHTSPNTRIMNWALKLSQYNFKVEYIPGKENIEADFLSRNPDFEINYLSMQEIEQDQQNFESPPPGSTTFNGLYVRYINNKRRYILSEEMAKSLIKRYHEDQGHIGQTQTAMHFSQLYYHKNQNFMIKDCINNCEVCLKAKTPRKKFGELFRLQPIDEPLQYVHIDTIGGFYDQHSQLRYLHVAIDAFSRFMWCIPSKTQGVDDFIRLIERIKEFGQPENIVCDRYPALTSNRFRQYLESNQIQLIHIPVTHPSSNGMVERLVQTVVERLRCKKLENPLTSWAVLARQVNNEYNNTIHTVTQFTPRFILTGQDPDQLFTNITEQQAREIAYQNSNDDHQRNKRTYDRHRRRITFFVGDWVYARIADPLNRRKLDPRYEGPFQIVENLSPTLYTILITDHPVLMHVENLKPANSETGVRGHFYDQESESDQDLLD